jgi:hypothetical protein
VAIEVSLTGEKSAGDRTGLFWFDLLKTLNQEGCALAWKNLLGVGLVRAVLLPELFRSAFFRCISIFGSDRSGIDEFLGHALRRQDLSAHERQTK